MMVLIHTVLMQLQLGVFAKIRKANDAMIKRINKCQSVDTLVNEWHKLVKNWKLDNTNFVQKSSEIIIENLKDEEEALTLNTSEKKRMLEQDKCSQFFGGSLKA